MGRFVRVAGRKVDFLFFFFMRVESGGVFNTGHEAVGLPRSIQ
jgi:hypothetical protein